jgi:prepilin peptidase CpaA
MMFTHAAAMAVALAGCVTDLRSRRIPNVLTLGAAAAAAAWHLFSGGLEGLGFAAGGWLVGGLIFLPLFALRGMGGGDVKLMAALGAWLGPIAVVWAALYAAIAGGVFALAVALATGYTRQAFSNVWSMLTYWRIAGVRPHPALTIDSARAVRLPYALPIAAGLVTMLWLR